MFKTLIYLATLSLALADGPFFTVQPKSDPNKCIDNRPLSGSDRSYASLQPCEFHRDGSPISTQLFQFDNQSPLAEEPQSERLYGFFPDGHRGCFADYIPDDESVFPEGGSPPGVVECSTAEEDKYGAEWWLDEWDDEGAYKFRKKKAGRYGLDKGLELRPKNRTGYGEQPIPEIWKVRTADAQLWTVRIYNNTRMTP